jgi:hypothetical protein
MRYELLPRGRFRWYRAAVRDTSSETVLLVRSSRLADELVHLLNDAEAGHRSPAPAEVTPFPRYICGEHTSEDFRLFRTEGALLGDLIARTSDGELCARAAMLLTRADPAKRTPAKTRMGWW